MSLDAVTWEFLQATIQCSRDSEHKRLRDLAGAIVDWEKVLTLAGEHRIVPLLYGRLVESNAPMPADVRSRLRTEYERNVFHSLANATELVAVLKKFDRENIPAMPFKGVVLAAALYGGPTSRSAGDLDVLIFEKDLKRATAILCASGYELKTKVHEDGSPAIDNYYEYHFERQADGMVLELRWRLELTRRRFRRVLGMDWVWPWRGSVEMAGAEVPNIDRERMLLLLCMHGCKHVWSRLIWVRDIAQLLEASPDLDWGAAIREARRVGLWRALALGVLLARRICGATVSDGILERFESDRDTCGLADYFERSVFEEPGKIPGGRMPYALRLLDFQDRIRIFLSEEIFRPNQRDMEIVRLPKILHSIYYLIRPLRILLDRSAR